MPTRVIVPLGPRLDLGRTLFPAVRGDGDPTTRVRPGEAWRAARTPEGPVTLRLSSALGGRIDAEAWGPGATWALETAPDLIGADENSGQVWAIDPNGKASLVVISGLPSGGDTGVESEGFVPPGFIAGRGFAYLADRGTPNNPFPGTDSILRISATALASAGIQDGDLLVATEGNGTTIAVRCAETCSVLPAAQGTNGGHIEGHIAFAPQN